MFAFVQRVAAAEAAEAAEAAAKDAAKIAVFKNPSLLHAILKAAAELGNVKNNYYRQDFSRLPVEEHDDDDALIIARASLVCKQWRHIIEVYVR